MCDEATSEDLTEDSKEGVASAVAMETNGVCVVKTEGPKELRTVFVSNLQDTVTKNRLKERFSKV